jgi:RNA polymerase sigma-70 factor (ECF subfamily)
VSAETLDVLLARLRDGDANAAEQVFGAYEPYLRMVVRQHLPRSFRTKFDSIDVVQSVWAHLLPGFRGNGWQFPTPAHFRAFLARVTRHRLTDRLRHYHTAQEREQPFKADHLESLQASGQPRPSELIQAEDLWEKMLALCPPAHHELLHLRRQGLSLTEIAQRTALHEGSVRRIFRKLARQLAFKPDRPDHSAGEKG